MQVRATCPRIIQYINDNINRHTLLYCQLVHNITTKAHSTQWPLFLKQKGFGVYYVVWMQPFCGQLWDLRFSFLRTNGLKINLARMDYFLQTAY